MEEVGEVEGEVEGEDESEEMEIEIPNLPRGKVMVLHILSTWGDSNYVGLNGIEFWNREGNVSHFKFSVKF